MAFSVARETSITGVCWSSGNETEADCSINKMGRADILSEVSTRLEDAVDARGTDCHDVGVDHHEAEPAIALQRMTIMKVEDCLPLQVSQPPVSWNLAVVIVFAAVVAFPLVEFITFQAKPTQ